MAGGVSITLAALAFAAIGLGFLSMFLIVGLFLMFSLSERVEREKQFTRRNPSDEGIMNVFNFLDDNVSTSAQPRHRNYYAPSNPLWSLRFKKYSQSALSEIATDMSEHLRISQTLKITVEENTSSLDNSMKGSVYGAPIRQAAGIYKEGRSHIVLLRDEDYNLPQLLAIMAHECTHHKLYIENTVWPNTADEEVFTDLAAVYFGFGRIMLRGYPAREIVEQDAFSDTMRTLAVGYITPYSIKRGMNILMVNRTGADTYQPGVNTQKRVMACLKCGQKLRVPDTANVIRVFCPSCNEAFEPTTTRLNGTSSD